MKNKKIAAGVDMLWNCVTNIVIASLPASPDILRVGGIYYNTTEDCLYICDGSAWKSTGSKFMTGEISNQILSMLSDIQEEVSEITDKVIEINEEISEIKPTVEQHTKDIESIKKSIDNGSISGSGLIDSIYVNGKELPIEGKAVHIEVPTHVSELSGTENYATKTETSAIRDELKNKEDLQSEMTSTEIDELFT